MLSPSSCLWLQHKTDYSFDTSIPRASLASPASQSGNVTPTQSNTGPVTNVRSSVSSCIVLLCHLIYSWSSPLGPPPSDLTCFYFSLTLLFVRKSCSHAPFFSLSWRSLFLPHSQHPHRSLLQYQVHIWKSCFLFPLHFLGGFSVLDSWSRSRFCIVCVYVKGTQWARAHALKALSSGILC